ncbi:MAG: CBS domain-containing protein [Mycobacterium sp.]|nr:CBS domain-containing protein [Mycobacterium sp.]
MNSSPSAGTTLISAIIGDPVECVPADATVADVAAALVAREVGAVVVGDNKLPTAIVSERDVVRVVATGKDLAGTPALDVASTKLVSCTAEATVGEVAVRMMDRYIRHILVERDGVLIGIVSARDLLGVYSADTDLDSV